MTDRPTKQELLHAVERFIDEDLVPDLNGRRQFLARVAANALRMVSREMSQGEPVEISAEAQDWSKRIRGGEFVPSDDRSALLRTLRANVRSKLKISNPDLLESDDKRGIR